MGLQSKELLLELVKPIDGKVNILQHHPASRFDGLIHHCFRLAESFGAADSDGLQFGIGFFGNLLNLEARVEPRCRTQQDGRS